MSETGEDDRGAQEPSDAEPEKVKAMFPPRDLAPPFLVAGVGASAGGLQAFVKVLGTIPSGAPLALILVQHLARDHESLLPELLAAKTALQVEDGIDGRKIEVGHVYVIRPNTHMAVVDGCLRVRARPEGTSHDAPIDHLFESMADQYRERAIGVVLSGGGSDGAAGIRHIRAVGGITMAQDPSEAQVDSMPRSAIATGAVDLVMSGDQLAAELLRLAGHPLFLESSQQSARPDGGEGQAEGDLQQILRLLKRSTGVDFTRYKLPTIERRLHRRMALHRVADLPAYLRHLKRDQDEARHLHDDILIHVTSFFRERESFEVLNASVLPQLIEANRHDGPLRAWVPGCSSGEEAYSLAMSIIEAMDRQDETVPTVVFGTDVSQRMIDQARTGIYPESIAQDVSAERLRRFFVRVEGGYRVSAEVRERCVFARQDVTRDPPFSKLDIVLCRNLLIYLGQAAQKKLISTFHYSLLPYGVLVLGRSETIGSLADLFSVMDARWKIYQRRPGITSTVQIDFGTTSVNPTAPSGLRVSPRLSSKERPEKDLHNEANRLLLDRYAPAFVIVDDSLRIVRSHGQTNTYLELPNGEASLEVLKMVRVGLMTPLRAAIHEVKAQSVSVRKEGLEFRSGDVQKLVNLEVSKMPSAEGHLLILFEDAGTQAPTPNVQPSNGQSTRDAAIEHLQHELTQTRADLQSMIQELEAANEELQSANEEILSSNEELQSTNEELDTAREELQSTNEELGTVNEELHTRNLELSRANGDLVNLLASVDIPIVMVTADLKIRRFTPAAGRSLNLIGSDVGRPIRHIKPNIGFPDLEAVMQSVVTSGTVSEREVEDHEGRTYLASVRPYRSVANQVEGALLALFDVSLSLKNAREAGEAVISTVRDPILLLDSNLLVRRANRAFRDAFSLSDAEVDGRSVFELDDGRWNIQALRRLLTDILPEQRNFESFPVDDRRRPADRGRLLLDGRRIESGRGNEGVILLIFREENDGRA